ncbi:MAG: hypothetical protein K2H41_12600 [Acetatifactor sp.]|nr:hypothetical protein [Acetatifactor sp.]
MRKYKYVVLFECGSGEGGFFSYSRNARKHLLECNADKVLVYDMKGNLICSACRSMDCILVGTREREGKKK